MAWISVDGGRNDTHCSIDAATGGRGALIARARAAGKRVLVAGVDSANVASLRFLEGSGFERVGHLREVGNKFGKFLDLVFLQYALEPLQRDESAD